MSTFKKLPWLSLVLLLATHITLGWSVSAANPSWYIWLLLVFGILLLDNVLTNPWSEIKDFLTFSLKSDTRAFLVIFATALLSVFIICWVDISVHVLVVTTAMSLVRLDTQTSGYSKAQSFWLMMVVSLAGLGLGGVAQTVIYNTLINGETGA